MYVSTIIDKGNIKKIKHHVYTEYAGLEIIADSAVALRT